MDKQRHFFWQCCCILALMTAILIQGLTDVVKMKPLKGFVKTTQTETLGFKTYYDGTYQASLTEWAKQHTGFREFFIRNYNQLLYSCFRKITNENIVEGEDRELFLTMYLNEITGKKLQDYYGSEEEAKSTAEKNVQRTIDLIQTLRDHGKDFLFVFAPTKTSVYPEKMPRSYQENIAGFCLEQYYIDLFKQYDIPHIDLYNYFKSISDTVAYPLYTRLASHWAESTIPWVADTILRKLESITEYHFPSIQVTDNNITTDYSDYDHELELSMNLLFPWPKPALPRPKFTLADTVGMDHPNLVVVGDSYFDQLMFSCFKEAFRKWDFWQYMMNVYSSRGYWNVPFENIMDTPKTLQEVDVVLAVFTAPMLYNYMNNFTERAYGMLETSEVEILQMMESIRNNPDWYQAVIDQAKERGLEVEDNLRINAIYVIEYRKNH